MNVRKLPTSKGIVPSFSKGGAGVVCGTMSQPMIKHIVYQLIWQTTPAPPLEKEGTSENHSKPIWQLADIHLIVLEIKFNDILYI